MAMEKKWKEILTPEQYHVTRQKGTERPFSHPFYLKEEMGVYCCVCCEAELFSSDTKFDAGCGWPSFYEPIHSEAVRYEKDTSHGMIRVEALCAKCDAHLGHVFDDGPEPTGLRYCINGISLDFIS